MSEWVREGGHAHQKLDVGWNTGMGHLWADDGVKGGHFMCVCMCFLFLTQEVLRGESEDIQRGDSWKNIPE